MRADSHLQNGSRAVPGLLLCALLLFLLLALASAATGIAWADPAMLFVRTDGSGALCSQAQPCQLDTALAQAASGDTVYLAGGAYTAGGGAVITLTHTITLYGGWDGTAATPPVRDPVNEATILDGEDQRRGVFISGGAPTLDGLVITRGRGDFSGGGIAVEAASPTVAHCQIISNTAVGTGGGISVNRGAAQIVYNQILSNTATWGGGLDLVNDVDATIMGNEIRGNTAGISGGAAEVECCGGTEALVARNLVTGNSAGHRGGAVSVSTTRTRLVNNILAGNEATIGAGLWLDGMEGHPAVVTLTHNTLVAAPSGGEGLRLTAYVTASLVNNIVAGYTAGITITAPVTSHLAAEHNLFWNVDDPVTGTQAVVADPLLDDAFHLTAGSPARDAGIAAGVAVDYDGDPRPIDGYDIGADEYLEMGYLTGTVTDEAGQPIAGIGVQAGDYDSLLDCQGAGYWAETMGDGSYLIEVSPGDYLVFVNSHDAPGGFIPEAYPEVNSWSQIASATRIVVASGQTVQAVDLSLPSGFIVTGRLVDERNQPVLAAGGNMNDPTQSIEFGCALGFGSSWSDGTFQVHVPEGTYDLSFGKGNEGYTVRYGIEISDDTDLGDVLFAPASEPRPVFDPQVLEPGYRVETVVPGGPNTPSDVAVLPDGTLYLAAIRSWNVYEVGAGGTLTSTAPVGVYALDAGPDGNLYGYFFPSDPGIVSRITPQGQVTAVGNLPPTSCESTLTVAPDLDLWIGFNHCGGTSMDEAMLYRLTQAGELISVASGLPFGIGGLDFDASGHLYMTLGAELFRVNTGNGSRTLIARLPGGGSSHGLEASPAGDLYITSAGEGDADRIFKVAPGGTVSVVAELPAACLQGLAWLPGDDLVATGRCTGALYRIHPDGTWQTMLPGNGMATPQAMAFSPGGELFVVNDESGRIVHVSGARAEPFAQVVSYISPLGFLAFEPSGDFYFSEAAPGFVPRLVSVSPQGQVTEVTRDVDWPSGLAFTPGGTLYVAEHLSGEVSSVSAEGTVAAFASGLSWPQSLAADDAGNLYVAGYEQARAGLDRMAADPAGGRIWKIDPAGQVLPYANLQATDLAFSALGELFATGPVGRQSGIRRLASDGQATPFAEGFLSAVGLAFDLAGNLYVSDDWHNSITRITGFPQGTIQGRVQDAVTGQPLPGAWVSVVTGYPVVLGEDVATGSDGRYTLPAAPRTYTVTATAPGYQSSSRTLTVQADGTATADLELMPWPSAVYVPLVLRAR